MVVEGPLTAPSTVHSLDEAQAYLVGSREACKPHHPTTKPARIRIRDSCVIVVIRRAQTRAAGDGRAIGRHHIRDFLARQTLACHGRASYLCMTVQPSRAHGPGHTLPAWNASVHTRDADFSGPRIVRCNTNDCPGVFGSLSRMARRSSDSCRSGHVPRHGSWQIVSRARLARASLLLLTARGERACSTLRSWALHGAEWNSFKPICVASASRQLKPELVRGAAAAIFRCRGLSAAAYVIARFPYVMVGGWRGMRGLLHWEPQTSTQVSLHGPARCVPPLHRVG